MFNADDTVQSLESAVAFVNGADVDAEDDPLESVDALAEHYERFGYTGRRDGTLAELDAVRALRPRLRELLTSSRDDAALIVNAILAEVNAVPQLARHGTVDWHLHALSTDAPLADRILGETALAMMDFIRADEVSRLRVCAADDCDGLVLDLSRNRSKRFCSTRCTNRVAVAAYRARQAASDE
ncbi:CGNR zinc finger domain-containing protein [Gordonia sp. TBRC 11910]|uniref:CGNR zinc finger domain-containing protein n=1 Tax=Gordonia asplenii TaxID=2725283 RepID=A0A848KUH6_9ACTN|nr:CGNR zinc finger domain-containing protein [Gordonia asplenii]NMO02180.1 CGNR zinc finger domain-containing protein [Gordonia asplenii]